MKHGGAKIKMFEGGDSDQNGSPACAWEDITGPGARPKTGASKGKWLENHKNNHNASKKLLLTLNSEKVCVFSAGLGSTIDRALVS